MKNDRKKLVAATNWVPRFAARRWWMLGIAMLAALCDSMAFYSQAWMWRETEGAWWHPMKVKL